MRWILTFLILAFPFGTAYAYSDAEITEAIRLARSLDSKKTTEGADRIIATVFKRYLDDAKVRNCTIYRITAALKKMSLTFRVDAFLNLDNHIDEHLEFCGKTSEPFVPDKKDLEEYFRLKAKKEKGEKLTSIEMELLELKEFLYEGVQFPHDLDRP